mgnify:CR=1 FL=1
MRDLPEIINWRRLNGKVTLSGQPTEDQLKDIKEMGVSHVINLGPHSNKGALDDQTASMAALGMEYIYIPVDFDNPTDADFEAFCAAMDQVREHTIHVHCIYNARVSAFFYRYAKTGRGGSETDALVLMDGIWRPGGVWATFIGDSNAVDLPSRYAGYDY